MKTLWRRLRRLLFGESAHYIHGTDTLPPPLTVEEETESLALAAAGDAEARDRLITHNLRLVVYIARKFESSGVCIEHLTRYDRSHQGCQYGPCG